MISGEQEGKRAREQEIWIEREYRDQESRRAERAREQEGKRAREQESKRSGWKESIYRDQESRRARERE